MADYRLAVVEFRVTIDPAGPAEFQPFVDGTALVDRVATYESEQGYKPVGGYVGLVPAHFTVGDLAAYLRGEPAGAWPKRGRCWLLGCACGEAGCWPLEAGVVATTQTVTWSDFAQPFRSERSYEGFGPFVFGREQYDAALADAISQLGDGAMFSASVARGIALPRRPKRWWTRLTSRAWIGR